MKYKALNNENDFIVFNAFKHWKLDPADIEVFILSNILPKQIIKEANDNEVMFLYESSVCAGTPIIKILNEELLSLIHI